MRPVPGGRNTIERIARFGYGARGTVYVVVGALALLAAIGQGGRAGDSKDALRAVLAGPFGAVVVGLIALGLAGFALWRFVEGVTDADRRGTSAKGLAVRGAHLVSAAIYIGLAVSAASLSLGLGMSGGDGMHDGTAWLLSKPFGRWLVALGGLCVIGGGFGFLGKAWRGDVTDRLALDAEARERWAGPVGRFGYAARGIAFLIIGGFLVAAAWHQRSSDAKGLTEAFALLRAQPYGWILLGLVAAGHAAFGAFGLIQARYRHIDAPDIDRVDDAAGAAVRALS
ncbi:MULTISPECIES: DUF1206 domain-containing protein [unclassified Methylobacterium]|uniref:DUF1206 domain-containing protein n=1 Tax=unclassified Methylobacterium TaxID=2615210 RepID=UPI0011C1EC5F|nr:MULTISPECIES: DUF1206 domain-containing protein [unclassified Methylobacterium]QEE38540.1 DUF1206 domain-containing protein [Methylobacterium sp. WL1]TXN02557.1 DUF1206 domain-containing protein [Methylobacterium sp. WL64]TXN52604.1 DUF1206 domain-containing protein [Methylobacterium sp. WL2]